MCALSDQVSLEFSGDVEISFKVLWHETTTTSTLAYVHFRLGKESFRIDSPQSWRFAHRENIVTHLVQEAIREVFREAERMRGGSLESLSPRMLAFLRAFVEHEAPFEALANGTFFPHVTAELFRDL
jgi:hypothetical protein